MGANSSHGRPTSHKYGSYNFHHSKLHGTSFLPNKGRGIPGESSRAHFDTEGLLKGRRDSKKPVRRKTSRSYPRGSHSHEIFDGKKVDRYGGAGKRHEKSVDYMEEYTTSESGSPSRSSGSSSCEDSSETYSISSLGSRSPSRERPSTVDVREGDVMEADIEVITSRDPKEQKAKPSLASKKLASASAVLPDKETRKETILEKTAKSQATNQVVAMTQPFKSRVTCRDIGLTEKEYGQDEGILTVHTYSAFVKMDSDALWKRTRTILERRIRGLQHRYKCTIQLGDRAQMYGTDTVYSITITGPSDEAVMRCRTSLPDNIIKRLITAYWHMDEEIEYGKVFTSNTKQKGLLNTPRKPSQAGHAADNNKTAKARPPPPQLPPNFARLTRK